MRNGGGETRAAGIRHPNYQHATNRLGVRYALLWFLEELHEIILVRMLLH